MNCIGGGPSEAFTKGTDSWKYDRTSVNVSPLRTKTDSLNRTVNWHSRGYGGSGSATIAARTSWPDLSVDDGRSGGFFTIIQVEGSGEPAAFQLELTSERFAKSGKKLGTLGDPLLTKDRKLPYGRFMRTTEGTWDVYHLWHERRYSRPALTTERAERRGFIATAEKTVRTLPG